MINFFFVIVNVLSQLDNQNCQLLKAVFNCLEFTPKIFNVFFVTLSLLIKRKTCLIAEKISFHIIVEILRFVADFGQCASKIP